MTTLRVWAPKPSTVELQLGPDRRPMTQDDGGWWSSHLAPAEEGQDYEFVLDGGDPRPDPRSACQPHGV